jgi:hypothetical protein
MMPPWGGTLIFFGPFETGPLIRRVAAQGNLYAPQHLMGFDPLNQGKSPLIAVRNSPAVAS